MSAVQLHCPHCGGLFQIDESLFGQQVACPLCASLVAIPNMGPPDVGPPPLPPELAAAPPPAPDALQMGCPVCAGLFQITPDMAGQQISCPHCYTAVLLPEFGSATPESPAADWASPPSNPPFPSAPAAPPETGARPTFPPASPPYQPTPVQEPSPHVAVSPREPAATIAPPNSPDDLLPPSAKPVKSASPQQVSPSTPSRTPDRKQPERQSAPPHTTESHDVSTPRPSPIEATTQFTKDNAPEPDELLPPSTRRKAPSETHEKAPSPEVDDLLPPGVKSNRPIAVKQAEPSEADDLLPPSADKTQKKRRAQSAGQETQDVVAAKPGVAADGSVLIPTEEGGYVALREPVKTVTVKGKEIELRRLTPEEKAQRRFKRNLFVASFGLLFLIVMMMIMHFLRQAF